MYMINEIDDKTKSSYYSNNERCKIMNDGLMFQVPHRCIDGAIYSIRVHLYLNTYCHLPPKFWR